MDVIMKSYFSGKWSDMSLDSYEWSGYRLVDEVNSHNSCPFAPTNGLSMGIYANAMKMKWHKNTIQWNENREGIIQ